MKDHSTQRKRFRRLVFLGGVILLALFFSWQGLLASIIGPVASPLVQLGTWISDRVFWWQASGKITARQLQDLYEERAKLAQKVADVQTVREENTLLRKELGFLEHSQTQAVAASVLAKSFSYSVNRFVVDVGTDQGVELGAAVVSGEGLYVGKVTQTGKRSATISALTDPTHSVAVGLLNEPRTIGVAFGSNGGLLKIDFIPTDEAIQENDLVVTSGLETLIPSGLIIGVINTVSQETGSPFQEAIVEPLTDVRRLSRVLILLSPDTSP
ncbi:rod shape-determining protein MreC [Candidatus Uhrbacteria bacterium]|nr:rod shape-determining protein MreC [Candidatus Uhrbacteria bacterium]